MHTIQGYYDGQNVQLLEEAPARKPQKVQVVFADVAENRTGADESLEERFERLFKVWYDETCYHSSGSIILDHPAFLQIIGLGRPAIPLIFKKIQEKDSFILAAMPHITGESPVPPEHYGRLDLIKKDWFEWGKRHGYLP